MGFWAAIFVRPSEMAEVLAAHREWEREIRRALKINGEVKGSLVDDAWARRFVSEVMGAAPFGVCFSGFAVEASPENLAAMEIQRGIFVDGYRKWAEARRANADPQIRKLAGQLDNFADWVAALAPLRMVKLITLMRILGDLVAVAVVASVRGRFDEELDQLAIHVDEGYVQTSVLPTWRDLLRNAIYDSSRSQPLPIMEFWTDEHPFMRAFVQRYEGTHLLTKPEFKQVISFRRSHQDGIVRLADVVVSLLRRRQAGALDEGVDLRLWQRSLDGKITVMQWNKTVLPSSVNPWLEFGRPDET